MGDAHDVMPGLAAVILLLALGLTAMIASRSARLSPIIGYLALGAGIAMFHPGLLQSNATIALLAELGVVFLLFDIGLHFSLSQIRAQAKDIFGFGPVQVGIATIGLGAVALIFGLTPLAAVLVGATLALSSTAVVASVIADRHQQNCPVGRTATAILIFQDVAAIMLLVIVAALGDEGAVLAATGWAFLKAAGAFCVAVVFARLFVRPLFSFLALRGGEEAFTAAALLVALSAGWAAAGIGLSMTLGAFLGGMAVAETPFRAKVRSEISPFRGLLLGFFFVAVGFSIDARVIAAYWPAILVMAALLMTIKVVTNGMASLIFRWSVPGSIQLGFLIAQGSEFAFVLLGLPGMQHLVGEPGTSILISAVALSLAATSPIAALGRKLAGHLRAMRTRDDHELEPGALAPPVLIVGMGETGRTIADAMAHFGIAYEALEHDPNALRQAIADGYAAWFGDPVDPAMWQVIYRAGRLFCILTAPRLDASRELTPIAAAFYPAVQRIAVVDDPLAASGFEAAGLRAIVREAGSRGLGIARVLLSELGIDGQAADRWIEIQQSRPITINERGLV